MMQDFYKIVLMGTGVIKKGYVVFPFFNSAPVTYKIYTELNSANDQWATNKKELVTFHWILVGS